MKNLTIFLALICFCFDSSCLVPDNLTPDAFSELMYDLNNIHYFIICDHLVTDHLIEHFTQYENQQHIKIYQCDSDAGHSNCDSKMPLYLIINTIKIQFNGHQQHPDDFKKWIQYRINEHPQRIHSVEELKKYVASQFEVFCYVDRQGEEITKKERIFLAAAKSMHYLHFCYLDQKIGKKLHLREGYVAIIKRDMSTSFDWRSSDAPENQAQVLYNSWRGFFIDSFMNDFRIEDRTHEHDQVLIECDMSLECEDHLFDIFKWEKIWRDNHLDLNFWIKIFWGTTAKGSISSNHQYSYPGIKYVVRTIHEEYEKNGNNWLLNQHVTSKEYLGEGIDLGENSVNLLLEMKEKDELKIARETSKINVKPIHEADLHQYSHLLNEKGDEL